MTRRYGGWRTARDIAKVFGIWMGHALLGHPEKELKLAASPFTYYICHKCGAYVYKD